MCYNSSDMSDYSTIDDFLRHKLPDFTNRFVFPSALVAEAWARRCVETGMTMAVDEERFIAWDRFKAICLSEDRRNQKPINQAARSIFSASILSENAVAKEKGNAHFSELVAPQYVSNWMALVSSFTRMLPVLDGFFHRHARLDIKQISADPYLRDLHFVFTRYSHFLKTNLLFEPAWGRVSFNPGPYNWVLFYPELVEDWIDYKDDVAISASTHIFGITEATNPFQHNPLVEKIMAGVSGKLIRFASAREEIIWTAKLCCRLIDDAGLDPSEIAISIPNIQEYAVRIGLEFGLHDLPVNLRKGKPLTEQSAGRFFSALATCSSTRWSFRALKDLLLDGAYPWKYKERIDAFLEFGLHFRCVSGYTENDRIVDVWEKTFERLHGHESELPLPLVSNENFYKKLKRSIQKITQAKTFALLRQALIEFKSDHFDVQVMHPDTDKVFARVLEELEDLADTEARLSNISIVDTYSLFLTHIKGVEYVFQSSNPGINIFDYRVAAGIPAQVHFILNATQDAAVVRSDPVPFLREDRKQQLRIEERDLSTDFLKAYAVSGASIIFTSAERGFSHHSVPHHFLMSNSFSSLPDAAKSAVSTISDPYQYEAALLAKTLPEPTSKVRACSSQAKGWISAGITRSTLGMPGPLDARRDPFQDLELRERIKARLCGDKDAPRISPTDLNELSSCPWSWLLRRGLGIRDKETEIATVDARELGSLYHRILERLFNRMSQESPRFRVEDISKYNAMLGQECSAALLERSQIEGAFQESVYSMLETKILSALEAFLDQAIEKLDAAGLVGAELPLRLEYPDYGLALSGKADLVIQANDGSFTLYDFKTGLVPRSSDLAPNDDGNLGNFQIAAYIRMIEKDKTDKIRNAAFYSIEDRKFTNVLSTDIDRKSNQYLPLTRDEYESGLDALDDTIQVAAGMLAEASFSIPPFGFRQACATCTVASVCRLPFSGGEPESTHA